MQETLFNFIEKHGEGLVKVGVSLLVVLLTYIAIRIYRTYIANTAERHRLAPQRSANMLKFGQIVICFISIALISNVFGFGIQGIFIATSSFFALVGIAFFANWSILSNVTASIFLYLSFPYRIGDRLIIEGEPKHSGRLTDVTLMYMKIKTDLGSYVTLPANVAIQKIITIQSEEDHQKMLEEQAAHQEET